MSTTYRAVVHCDAQRSVACHGLLEQVWADAALAEALTESGAPLDVLLGRLAALGWQRSYRATGASRDVCPVCWGALHGLDHERAAAERRPLTGREPAA